MSADVRVDATRSFRPRSGSARKAHGKPSRRPRWGQNFLTDRSVARSMVDWARIEDRSVLEIGPGRGALTELLVERARRVLLVEIDPELAGDLRERYRARENVEVLEEDALALDFRALHGAPFHVVASLPYESGTAILQRLLEAASAVTEAVVMLQKEVCERILAGAGSRQYGALSIHTSLRADVTAGRLVSPASFHPKPRVESQILRVRPLGRLRFAVGDERVFGELVRLAFGGRRKMLRNSVGRSLEARLGAEATRAIFAAAGVDPSLRPEAVSPEQFSRLSYEAHQQLSERARTP